MIFNLAKATIISITIVCGTMIALWVLAGAGAFIAYGIKSRKEKRNK